jgi:hypothetical protein
MILVKTSDMSLPDPDESESGNGAIFFEVNDDVNPDLVPFQIGNLTKSLGDIVPGRTKHYYSDGNFNIMRLIFHLIKQIGPCDILLSTYSISQTTLEQIQARVDRKEIRSIRFLIDNRVKVMSPKPFQLLKDSFPYACISLHAKVALLWNQDWKLSIVTSQNATDNPKLERGVIFSDEQIFNYDKTILENAFKRGTD